MALSNNWKIETFTPIQIDQYIKSHKFESPEYQRGIVWKESQREALLDSIKKGLPFGVLLLYKDDNSDKYQIIDGLQRSTTLGMFVSNPTKFFSEEDIERDTIFKVIDLLGLKHNASDIANKITKAIITRVKQYHTLKDITEAESIDLAAAVNNLYSQAESKLVKLSAILKPILENYKNVCIQIRDKQVPAIVVSGDEELLPILFERINSKGTQLTKYQIFAATWGTVRYQFSDSELSQKLIKFNIDFIKSKFDTDQIYTNEEDEEYTLNEYDFRKFERDKNLNVFQICYGMGKYLSEQYPYLFGKKTNASTVDGFAFSLLAMCLALRNKDIKKLHTQFQNYIQPNEIETFLDKVVQAAKRVSDIISPYNEFKLNSKNRETIHTLHPELQMVAIVGSVFLSIYSKINNDIFNDINFADNDKKLINYDFSAHINPTYNRNLKKYLPMNYFIEILSAKWKSSGDSRIDRLIEEPEYYANEIGRNDLKGVLESWYTSLNRDRNEYKKVAKPKEPELLFLTMLYLKEFNAMSHLSAETYDVEHLCPRDVLLKTLEKFKGELKLPISSIGNLCILPSSLNRSKKTSTIYSDKKFLDKSNYKLTDVEDQFTFTKLDDLNWLEKDAKEMTSVEFETAYLRFIDKHFNIMKERLLDNWF